MGKNECPSVDFIKMQGAGNDYIYIDALDGIPEAVADNPSAMARLISDRHFGIGSDGMVLILPSDKADFRMRMFNADGSEAGMCGNASRCVAKLVYEAGLADDTTFTLETEGGIRTLSVHPEPDGTVHSVTVDMGAPVTDPARIPAHNDSWSGNVPCVTLRHGDISMQALAINMGNPHGVIFVDDITDRMVTTLGPLFEKDPAWPEKANIEFVRILAPDRIRMRVWERGTGETLACGTGSCAAVAAGIMTGRISPSGTDIELPGGTLHVALNPDNGHLLMTGPAETTARGRFFIPCDGNNR